MIRGRGGPAPTKSLRPFRWDCRGGHWPPAVLYKHSGKVAGRCGHRPLHFYGNVSGKPAGEPSSPLQSRFSFGFAKMAGNLCRKRRFIPPFTNLSRGIMPRRIAADGSPVVGADAYIRPRFCTNISGKLRDDVGIAPYISHVMF